MKNKKRPERRTEVVSDGFSHRYDILPATQPRLHPNQLNSPSELSVGRVYLIKPRQGYNGTERKVRVTRILPNSSRFKAVVLEGEGKGLGLSLHNADCGIAPYKNGWSDFYCMIPL